MIYTDLTKKAMKISYMAHHGSYDKGGVPYVFHPFHVAEQMDDEYSICVALLHDVVEDTEYTISDIEKYGFPKEVIDAIKVITREKGQDYMEYIKIVKTNTLATKVKLADLDHNSDSGRLVDAGPDTEKRLAKYEAAKKYLLS